ncbi:hypothetical protein Tco_0346359, partial [Tanacetum coccineum]
PTGVVRQPALVGAAADGGGAATGGGGAAAGGGGAAVDGGGMTADDGGTAAGGRFREREGSVVLCVFLER